jgi:hypothetical protein
MEYMMFSTMQLYFSAPYCCSHLRMGWMASKTSIQAVERVLHKTKLPAAYGSNVKELFSTPGNLKSVDWVHLAGPLGVWIISLLDIRKEYKDTFRDFLMAIYRLRGHKIVRAQLPDMQTALARASALMEARLPLWYAGPSTA